MGEYVCAPRVHEGTRAVSNTMRSHGRTRMRGIRERIRRIVATHMRQGRGVVEGGGLGNVKSEGTGWSR